MNNIRIGDVLIEYGYIKDEQLQEALEYQKAHKDENKRLGTVLVELGAISEAQMQEALAKRLNIGIVDLSSIAIDPLAVEKIPEKLAKLYGMIAYEIRNNELLVAVEDPLNFYGIEDVRQITELRLVINIDTKKHIEAAIKNNYGAISAKSALQKASNVSRTREEAPAVEDLSGDAPVVQALNSLLLHGYNMGASDIHIEPFESYVAVRVRVDGVIKEITRLATNIHLPLIARIKIMAEMDIAERRIPQDGHFKTVIDDTSINARVSMVPTITGEKAVIRFIFEEVLVDDPEKFGMTDANYEKFANILSAPHGMVYITGPTGSGKTTTLYMVLEKIAQKPINIETIEDPVERDLPRISQMQVNNQAGLTFEAGLRALLRQDPDVIMVGETRDSETAEIAVRAAITGHVVFSTIHTNSAISAIVRLQDMGVPAYLVANSLSGLVAQRLIRKVCTECGEMREATPDECIALRIQSGKVREGKGCPHCNGTGYKGRMAVHEVVEIDKALRRLIVDGADVETIEKTLMEAGKFKSLREEAAELVLKGVTSVTEYQKVAHYTD